MWRILMYQISYIEFYRCWTKFCTVQDNFGVCFMFVLFAASIGCGLDLHLYFL